MASLRLARASGVTSVGRQALAVTDAAGGPPWLENRQWAAREIRTEPLIRGGTLMAAYGVLGWIPVLLVVEVLTTPQPVDELFQMVAVAVMTVFLLGWLTYSWLGHHRYGTSVCRLLTLPGTIGGRFEADIECGLTTGSGAPVIVRLKNRTLHGKLVRMHWQMESRVESDAIVPLPDGRVLIPVRLEIPKDPAQRPCAVAPERFVSQWLLELSRASAGIDYWAEFDVPVFEHAQAPGAGREPSAHVAA